MAGGLKHLMAHQSVVNPVLIGRSVGGKMAMEFAQNYRKALDALLVTDVVPRAYDIDKGVYTLVDI